MTTDIQPIGDRLLVSVKDAESVTASGIVIPNTAQEKPHEGIVHAVGEGRWLESGQLVAPGVNEGDTIVFSKYGGHEVKYGSETFMIIDLKDVLAVIRTN